MIEYQFDAVLTDRGSKYAVSGGRALTPEDAKAVVADLKRRKKYNKATHNSWAARFAGGAVVKSDDGESGAGMVILWMLEQAEVSDTVVIVTRWYGGVKLGGDRFRHVKTAVRYYLDQTKP